MQFSDPNRAVLVVALVVMTCFAGILGYLAGFRDREKRRTRRAERDPRKDPRAGDVIRLVPGDKERTVAWCRFEATAAGPRVCVGFEDGSYTDLQYGMASAEVIHASPEGHAR
jgi:hypothetical protein